MTLLHILVFTAFCLLAGFVLPARSRLLALLAGSVLAVYWLQPALPIRSLDFWLPTTALALTVLVWTITQSRLALVPDRPLNRTVIDIGVVIGVVFLLGLTRYVEPLCCLTPSRPPEVMRILAALGMAGLVAALPARVLPRRRFFPAAFSLLILSLFVMLKSELLARGASAALRSLSGQDAALASPLDLSWLGFSYLAFRLLHALRDFQNGRLPAYSLGEFVTYAVFFPAYTAGPIDRSQHFITELRRSATPELDAEGARAERAARLQTGSWRILWGVFKKFAVADSLALFALNAQNATQVNQSGWAWVLLYAYALRIYFDFSGYTDIALGLSRLVGITLPENFDRPYLRTNLTAFWNSWHITLAQWFRAYFFNPLTRALRGRPERLPAWLIILIGQLGVMGLIGLWHGITWNFLIWGAWHGLGLFAHNRWSGWIRPRLPDPSTSPFLSRLLAFSGWAATFNYVALGWVWFALPAPDLALAFFDRLMGI